MLELLRDKFKAYQKSVMDFFFAKIAKMISLKSSYMFDRS